MLNSVEDIYKAFLLGINMSKMSTVLPDKFVRIWNEWALRDWMKTHGLFDETVSLDPIIRDKFRNLIRRYFYAPDDGFPWRFSIPDGIITGYGPEIDPTQITTTGTGGNNQDSSPIIIRSIMEEYVRHLTCEFLLDYDTNDLQECNHTGFSDWIGGIFVRANADSVFRKSYYLKPSDERLYYKIIDNKIYVDNGKQSECAYLLLEYIRVANHMIYNEETEEITYDIDLNEDQLEEVVDSAVRIHLEGVTSQRYQTFLNEEKVRHR
jgi:hypothetical protein